MDLNGKWTVLIYANGNNDLEPEIHSSFKSLLQGPRFKSITVIIQISRASQKLIKTLRPSLQVTKEDWEGTQRYIIDSQGTRRADDLGNINMADPRTLVDFITWGTAFCPAEHIMVVLSGHGAGFAGLLADYSQHYPMMMGIDGLASALGNCRLKAGRNIDVLVLDACFMNLIEVWYELALHRCLPVKYIVASLGITPLEGIPYRLIIERLRENTDRNRALCNKLKDIISNVNFVTGLQNGIHLITLDKDVFSELKNAIDNLAGLVLKGSVNLREALGEWHTDRPNYPMISLLDLEDRLTVKYPDIFPNGPLFRETLSKIILGPELTNIPKNKNLGPSIYLPTIPQQYLALEPYYKSLLFSSNNRWVQLLRGGKNTRQLEDDVNEESKSWSGDNCLPPPFHIPVKSLVASIMNQNPDICLEQAWIIAEELGWYIKK